jgi:hypothetical protein
LESLKGRDNLEDLGTDRGLTLKWILGKQGAVTQNRFMWVRIGTNDRLLSTW